MNNATWYGSCLALALFGASGCSDPVPPPAQGGVTVGFTNASPITPGLACSLKSGPSTFHVGSPSPGVGANGADSSGNPLVDGQGGASVSCSVKGAGATFAFTGSLRGPAAEATVVQVRFSGTVTDGTTSYLSGSAYTGTEVDELSTGTDMGSMCAVTVIQHQVKNGAIWASFNCPHMDATPSAECAVTGEFVFQNCDGS